MSGKVMVGLEIHIQLRGTKLFCNCSTESAVEGGIQFDRRLTATTGESGRYDPAAIYEKARSRTFAYVATDNSCLLEADEEPPHSINEDALKKAVATSLALNCSLVDKVSYMRKIVIDGSNTSGFQRTAIIGFHGYVETSRGRVGISTLCLEEDSARKLSEKNGKVVYSLDRLGIPLMEIATDPDIVDADHAVETAEIIGKTVLLAGWARKAPDAIRQDVNFSMGFGRVEIKGVPKLTTIRDAISYEAERQSWISELVPRISGMDWNQLHFVEVTDLFKNTKSKVISKKLSENFKVYGTILPGLEGYLKHENYRMGRELADVAKLFGSGGIMHSDELPGYGVEGELKDLLKILSPKKGDGYTLIVSKPEVIGHIEKAMKERLEKLSKLDLPETRVVSDDGTTHYLRPLPGGERMYPETDIQLIHITPELLEESARMAPRSEDEMVSELVSQTGISRQDASVIITTGRKDDFLAFNEALANSRLASRILLQTIPEIERKRNRQVLTSEVLPLLKESGKKSWDRQVLETALELSLVKDKPITEILASDQLRMLDMGELEKIISEIAEDEEVSQKNIIPKLRSRTDRMFDPSMAIKIVSKLKS